MTTTNQRAYHIAHIRKMVKPTVKESLTARIEEARSKTEKVEFLVQRRGQDRNYGIWFSQCSLGSEWEAGALFVAWAKRFGKNEVRILIRTTTVDERMCDASDAKSESNKRRQQKSKGRWSNERGRN